MSRGGMDDAARCLDNRGYCVLRGLLPPNKAEACRAMMDECLGPPCKDIEMSSNQSDSIVWGQKNVMWPAAGATAADGGAPVIHTGRYQHSLQHPLYDSRAALPVEPLVAPLCALLRSSPASLKLLHQNFRRTDPSPPPYPVLRGGVQHSEGDRPAAAFHMDSAFLPAHYTTTPRRNYYIAITALSPVVTGGAAFMYAPGSLQAAQEAAAKLPDSIKLRMTAKGCRKELPKLVGQGAPASAVSKCRSTAQEVYMQTGDTLVLDPMLSHAGSCFREGVKAGDCTSRYVVFSLVADAAAIGVTLAGLRDRNYTAPATKYTTQMKQALPAELAPLLEWQLPDETDGPSLRLSSANLSTRSARL